MSSSDPHEPQVMETMSPQKLGTRDTECYLEIFQTVTLSVKLHSWIPSLSIERP